MTCPILFLDADGVLNRYSRRPQPVFIAHHMETECVTCLNHVLAETGCQVVLSSDWRQLVWDGHKTLDEMQELFIRRGVIWGESRLVDVTPPESVVPGRTAQIRAWLGILSDLEPRWAVVDDAALGPDFGEDAWRFVQTDPYRGLQDADVVRLVALLKGGGREQH